METITEKDIGVIEFAKKTPKTAEERAKTKADRLLEKAMRVPINDTILQIQNGQISMKSLFSRIEAKVKEGQKDGR